MKKIAYYPLLVTMLFSTIIKSQSVTWGTEIDEKSDYNISGAIGKDSKGFFVKRLKINRQGAVTAIPSSDFMLEKYDFNGNRLFSKEITVMDDKETTKPMYYDGIFCMKNNLVTVMYERGVKTAYLIKVNFDGSIDSKKTILGDVENNRKADILAEKRYEISLSDDSSKFIAYYHNAKSTKMEMKFYDENLNLTSEKFVDFSYLGSEIDREDAYYNGDQAIFLVHFTKVQKGSPDFYAVIYNLKTGTVKKMKLDVYSKKDGYFSSNAVTGNMSSRGDVAFSALYSSDASNGDPTGFYCARINHNASDFSLSKSFDFSSNFLSEFISEKDMAKGKGISRLSINGIKFAPDGSIVIAAECAIPLPDIRLNGYFGLGSVIIAKIGTDGNLNWIKKIAKKQRGDYTIPCFSSYVFVISSDKVNLLFNDSKKNVDVDREQAAKNESMLQWTYHADEKNPSFLIMESLNLSDGAMKLTNLSNPNEAQTKLCFRSDIFLQINNSTISILNYWYFSDWNKKRSIQFGRVNL